MRDARRSRVAYRLLLRLYPRSFRERFEADLELDFADLIRQRGPRAAWRQLLGDLGPSVWVSHSAARAERRRVSRLTLGESSMGSLRSDICYALRTLAASRVFSIVTIATLALGFGANSAIFSLVNAALLRPLGYVDPDRLMMIYEAFPARGVARWGMSPPDFEDLVQYQESFTALGAYRLRAFELSAGDRPEEINAAQVMGPVFSILGVGPARGRILGPEDTDDPLKVVLSHGLWQRQFGGRDVVGERIVLSRVPYTIVGVMPASFEFPKRGPQFNGEPADLWMPLLFTAGERQARGNFYNHSVIGRLRNDVSQERAVADIAALADRIRANYPALLAQFSASLVVTAAPLTEEISGGVRRPLWMLLGAVSLVLLVACANVANLMLGRAVARERELGVRTALGASRARIFRMLLIESVLLATAAGSLGLLLAQWSVHAIPETIATSLPGVSDVTLDATVVGYALAVSMLTAIIFTLVPMLTTGRRSLNDLLRDGGASIGSARRHRVQAGLVVASVALAFMLLSGAGLLTRSLMNLLSVDPGVRAANVLSLRLSLPFSAYNSATVTRPFYLNLQERLAAVPGVRAATIATDRPIAGDGERRVFTPDVLHGTGAPPPTVAVTWVHGDYFGTFGIPLVRGRAFLREEEIENRFVAIVSRGLADRYWPGEEVVGRRVRWGIASMPQPPQWMTIVGIAGDVIDGGLWEEPIDHIYVPYSELPDGMLAVPVVSGLARNMTIAVHGDTEATSLANPIRTAIAALDRALAVTDVVTMDDVLSDALAPERFSVLVLSAFAVTAMMLAAIGLYGVLAFGVVQRAREIGVRVALGAEPSTVVRLVLRQGILLTAIGLVLGAVGALAAAQLMARLLYDTTTYDPWTFASVATLLSVTALVACYLPARRAARIDPLVALRID